MERSYTFCISYVILAFISLNCASENVASDEGDWLHFIDDYGSSLVLNFSTIIEDTQDLITGDVYFYLYTRNNMLKAEKLVIPEMDEPFQSIYFNKSNDIRVVTHGWRTGETVDWIRNIKEAFLLAYDFNVITVDWYELSKSEIYPLAAVSTRYVGNRIAELIDTLVKTYNLSSQNIHLIGHSLGAHVMGYAGILSKEKIFRITGLDPARPLFEIPLMPPDFRLDKSDAEFVDIIHTCRGVYGYSRSYGHADFFPNNGLPNQPGCSTIQHQIEACSHSRSHDYFAESIEYNSENGFTAYLCDNWIKFDKGKCKENPTTSMGYPASAQRHGNYYLRTKNESKYAMQ